VQSALIEKTLKNSRGDKMRYIQLPTNKWLIWSIAVWGLVSLTALFTTSAKATNALATSAKTPSAISEKTQYTKHVNPFIGTDGTGHTFPGATYPFGMVQPSPNTNNHSWDHTSGYQYQDNTIMGFAQNHLNGTGISDLGNILLQPFTGSISDGNYRSEYTKQSESAKPGLYQVTLNRFDVDVALTASERVAFHQYQFNQPTDHKVYLDLQHGVINQWQPLTEFVEQASVTIEDEFTISGMIETSAWVTKKTFFVISFNHPVKNKQTLAPKAGEKAPKMELDFGDIPTQELLVKVALSSVSVDGAKKNLIAEVPHWDFDLVYLQANQQWHEYLSRIDIEASAEQKAIFYTGLYHLFIQPNQTADVDGQYRGFDDNIHQAIDDGHYSTFSLWDTYRAAHPLYTILVPEKVDDFVTSLIAQQQQQGFFPIWGLANKETYTMIGNHGVPVVVDAVLKGISGIDKESAWQSVRETLFNNHKNSDWQLLEQHGYYPFDLLDRDGESVSRTLEHSYDDFAAAQLAKFVGAEQDYKHLMKRSNYYKALFDKETGFMRGKDSIGKWREDFDPLEATSPMNNPGDYTEANAYQYSWAAQHDTDGMIELFGSKQAFVNKLDEFFSTDTPNPDIHLGQEAMIGQYAHGNEPSHHIAYLYALAGRPDKTNQLVTTISEQFYANTPDGIQGNEDAGQMSAWYIFTALGFYPVDPAIGEYVYGVPQVDAATITLRNGNQFNITKDQNLDLKKSPTIKLNNTSTVSKVLLHEQLLHGGQLSFQQAN